MCFPDTENCLKVQATGERKVYQGLMEERWERLTDALREGVPDLTQAYHGTRHQ